MLDIGFINHRWHGSDSPAGIIFSHSLNSFPFRLSFIFQCSCLFKCVIVSKNMPQRFQWIHVPHPHSICFSGVTRIWADIGEDCILPRCVMLQPCHAQPNKFDAQTDIFIQTFSERGTLWPVWVRMNDSGFQPWFAIHLSEWQCQSVWCRLNYLTLDRRSGSSKDVRYRL